MSTCPERPLSRLRLAPLAFALAAALLGPGIATATVSQRIYVEYDPEPDRSGTSVNDVDRIIVPTSSDVDRDLFASVADSGGLWGLSGSVGRFGNFGVQGFATARGSLLTQVEISSDEFVNRTGVPQRLQANFIIDGGELVLDFAPGAELDLILRLDSSSTPFEAFSSQVTLSDPLGGTPVFTTRGNDLGATFDGSSGVEIPFSFQSVDLGVLAPGERLSLDYILQIRASIPNFAEILNYRFADPFDVSGSGAFPGEMDVTMTPIPEPGTGTLLGLALAGLAGIRPVRRRG